MALLLFCRQFQLIDDPCICAYEGKSTQLLTYLLKPVKIRKQGTKILSPDVMDDLKLGVFQSLVPYRHQGQGYAGYYWIRIFFPAFGGDVLSVPDGDRRLVYVLHSHDGSRADSVTCQVSKEESPIFQIRVEDVAQYATTVVSSFGGEGLKEDLCETLDASVSDAPDSIGQKLMDKAEDHILNSVTVVVKLIVNGFLPPPGLHSSILGIFLAEDGNDLTNHLLETQTTAGGHFRENLGKLVDNAEPNQSLAK
ncbi:hypothetical protein AnigIFM63604_003289 [Aspergillus niger]|uniref:Uncharacterized protein n=1 Tax=Aspergillus niger TaxID=5061 RepID=A0A9W6ADH9_ASPNG|nr:hypothetical protein AnigIFM63604_003289 [Aspergillus niger]